MTAMAAGAVLAALPYSYLPPLINTAWPMHAFSTAAVPSAKPVVSLQYMRRYSAVLTSFLDSCEGLRG